jgi:NADPH:quinone reductase-like Zn-dependent oxidoreductase
MKAVIQREYGGADVLEVAEVGKPVIRDDEVLIRVRAASIHAGDVLLMQGTPYVMRVGLGLRRPRNPTPGIDVAGTVEAVGSNVSRFQPGDDVFGEGKRTLAEYAAAKESRLAAKPENLTFEEAAVLTVSGLTALKAVRDVGEVQPGQSVLINGAAGGIGVYAIQIAKALGAEVTAVCSSGKADLVRSLGADHVIDYTEEDFTQGDRRYNFILDNVGNRSLSDCRRVLTSDGTLIPNSGTAGGKWIGPLVSMGQAMVTSPFVSQRLRTFLSTPNEDDLNALVELVESGELVPVIGNTYQLSEAAEALRVVADGHAEGKVVVTVAQG